MSAPLQARPIATESNIESLTTCQEHLAVEQKATIPPNTVNSLPEDCVVPSSQEQTDLNAMDVDIAEDASTPASSISPVNRKKIKIDSDADDGASCSLAQSTDDWQPTATVAVEPAAPIESEIVVLGDRNAVLFSLETAQRASFDDIHDSFFELTVNDVRTLLRDLKAQAQNLDDAPLLTARMRAMHQTGQTLVNLNRYKKAVIRIQFPDRLVLQGTFAPIDTVQMVMDFIRPYLENDKIDFHLCMCERVVCNHRPRKSWIIFVFFFCVHAHTDTTPPKQLLAKDDRLIEIQCVPSALLHFGVTDSDGKGKFLKDEYANRLSSPSAALLAASKSR